MTPKRVSREEVTEIVEATLAEISQQFQPFRRGSSEPAMRDVTDRRHPAAEPSEGGVMFHRNELTDEEARAVARATIVKIREQQQTSISIAEDLLADIVRKAIPYGTQDGDFIASYILSTGPIHRAIAYLNERGIPSEGDAS